jgi:hypothetical protein
MKVAAEARLLLACLRRAAGWTDETLDFSRVDAGRFLDVLDDQRLAPWLARRQERLPGLPDAVRSELNALYYREARDAGARWLELRAIRAALDGGPSCVLLKGGALLASLYAELAERPMWDVDLLVAGEAQADDIVARLTAIGFASVRAERAHHHRPALRRPGGDLAVEIHLDLHTPSPGPRFREAVLRSATPAPAAWTPFLVPSRPALVAHAALHAFSDLVDSPLLRNVFELAQLVRTLDAGELEDLQALVAQTPFQDTIARTLACAHRWFGSPAPGSPPAAGWPETLAEWRITHLGHEHRRERLVRHLAREMGEKLKQGWSPHSALLPLVVGVQAAGRSWSARLGRSAQESRRPGAEWCSMEVDGHLLVADPHSGAVHLLQPAAAAVWRSRETWSRPEHRETVAALRQAGLIRDEG